jgi:hypothetical protein
MSTTNIAVLDILLMLPVSMGDDRLTLLLSIVVIFNRSGNRQILYLLSTCFKKCQCRSGASSLTPRNTIRTIGKSNCKRLVCLAMPHEGTCSVTQSRCHTISDPIPSCNTIRTNISTSCTVHQRSLHFYATTATKFPDNTARLTTKK